MPTVLQTPDEETLEEVIADRRQRGLDRFDEVWEGTYVVMNSPNWVHQELSSFLLVALTAVLDRDAGDRVVADFNVTDREDDYRQNYRIPDLSVVLAAGSATIRDSSILGGPDLAIEIVSPRDRSREKIDFYAAIGVRELLFIDRDPWALDLWQLEGRTLKRRQRVDVGEPPLQTVTVPLDWSLAEGSQRPEVVLRSADGRSWRA